MKKEKKNLNRKLQLGRKLSIDASYENNTKEKERKPRIYEENFRNEKTILQFCKHDRNAKYAKNLFGKSSFPREARCLNDSQREVAPLPCFTKRIQSRYRGIGYPRKCFRKKKGYNILVPGKGANIRGKGRFLKQNLRFPGQQEGEGGKGGKVSDLRRLLATN